MLLAAKRYDDERRGLGEAFLDEIADAIRSMKQFPMASVSLSHRHRRFVMRRVPYQLVYEVRTLDDTIIIIAIAHFKRKPGYWRGRSN